MEEEPGYFLWINWEQRIVSFHEVEGFTPQQYPSYEERFQFAVQKTMEGFAIQ